MPRRRSRPRQQPSTAPPAPAADRKTRLAVPLLVAAVVLAYGNSLSAPFHFDDFAPLENEMVRQSLPQVTPTPQLDVQVAGRPIVRASFALNYAWSGVDATGYHVFTIGVHIVCTLLFFSLVRDTLSRWAEGDWRRSASSVALWSGLVWAVPPFATGAAPFH